MFIRKLLLVLSILIGVTACSSVATPTLTPFPTLTPVIITATALPTHTPTSIPTNTPPPTATLRPTAIIPPACTDNLTFIADMSLPDGTTVTTGATVTKTWRVRNDGTCTWNNNYTFRQIAGDALTATTIASPVVGRGQIVDISVTLTVGTNLALYDDLERATFRMFNASGIGFGDTPYVEVAIQSSASSACTNGMTIISSPTEIGVLSSGEALPVSWTIRNSGTCTWNNYTVERLGSGSPLLATNLPLTVPVVEPGQSYIFTANAQFADGARDSGLYNMVMVLMDTGNNSFGESFIYQAEFDNGTACEWDSDFVSDVTIPDGTVVNTGQSFTKTWRLENSGTCPWDNFSLRLIEDQDDVFEVVSTGGIVNLPFVAPGEEVDVSVSLRLRSTASAGESYRARFQIMGVESTLFGTMPYVEVEVGR